MGLFSKPHDFDKVVEDEQYYKEEAKMLEYKQEAEERKAIISKLKAMHGKNWKSILGLGNNPDNSTLRSLLNGFKVKSKDLHTGDSVSLSPLPCARPKMPNLDNLK